MYSKSRYRSFFLFAVKCFVVSALWCQNSLRDDFNGVYYTPSLYMQKYDVQEGSPYVDVAFTPARINGRKSTNMVRFNAYEGTVEVLMADNKVIMLTDRKSFEIQLLDGSEKHYITTKYKDLKGNTKTSFLQKLHEGNGYTLFVKERKKYFKKTKAEGYAAAKPARFEKAASRFFLKLHKDDGLPFYLPSGKKKFLALFDSEQTAKIKAFLKQEKIDLDSQEGMLRVLNMVYGA